VITRREVGAAALLSSAVAASWRATGGTRARVAPNHGAPTLYINDVPNRPIKQILGLPLTPRFREYLCQL
jgi:hypothetical protein